MNFSHYGRGFHGEDQCHIQCVHPAAIMTGSHSRPSDWFNTAATGVAWTGGSDLDPEIAAVTGTQRSGCMIQPGPAFRSSLRH